MPNWETFYIDYSPSDEERTALEIELQRQCDRMIIERYQDHDKEQQAIKEHKEFLQQQYKRRIERELLRKEKERYPLFFWKENI